MVYGYTGRILRVDLTREKTSMEPTNMKWARMFLGGKGLGAKYLFEESTPRVDALAPDNIMIFMTGPLTGTIAPCTPKHVVITKSPLTGAFLDSYAGGYFGAELKFAGFDAVIMKGKAKHPVYVFVSDGRAQVKDAERLWGKDTHETEKLVKEELGDKEAKVASIGPAGENLVKYSCITNDFYRQSGRGGAGAIMGSKNLKALAVRGTQGVSVPNIEEFVELSKEIDASGFMLHDPGERDTTIEQQRKSIERILTEKNTVFLVAEADNKLVGFIAAFGGKLIRNKHSAYLVLGILEAYQGQGIATILFQRIFEWAKEVGISRLELTVIKENIKAFNLYRKMGFVVEGEKVNSLMINGEPVNEYYLYKFV